MRTIETASCRICLEKSGKLKSLYKPQEEGDDPPVEMISLLIGCPLEGPDELTMLPKCICKSCELSLNLAYQFRLRALETQQVIDQYCAEVLQDSLEERDEQVTITAFEIDTKDASDSGDEHSQQKRTLTLLDASAEMSAASKEVVDEEQTGSTKHILYQVRGEYNGSEVLEVVEFRDASCFSEADDEDETQNANSSNTQFDQVAFAIVQELDDVNAEKEPTEEEKERQSESLDDSGAALEGTAVAKQKPKANKSISKGANEKHICDICGNVYGKRGRMLDHRRRHDKELRYACEFCDERFHQRELLRKHLYDHTGGKPFQCNYCSRKFYYESLRKAHEDVHKGVKPYVCKTCDKAFAYSHTLKKHELIHTKTKLYHCKYCDKDFRLQHHMKQHEETKIHQAAVLQEERNSLILFVENNNS